jgi:hypothetical protein
VVGEWLGIYPNLPLFPAPTLPMRVSFFTDSKPILAYTVYADGVELTDNVDYRIVSDRGAVVVSYISDEGLVQPGSVLTIDYSTNPAFSGYKESVARAQDDANIVQAGELRHASYDYPFYTNDFNAHRQLALLLRTVSRSLWEAEWDMDRSGYSLAAGDVVKLTYVELDQSGGLVTIVEDIPFRILTINAGTLDDRTMHVTAVEDVWGEDMPMLLPPPPGTPGGFLLTAPDIAIGYAATSAIQICLFPADENFNIEIQRSTSSLGTSPTTLTTSLPGTTGSYTDTQTPGTILYYRARLVPSTSQVGYTAGDYTPWQQMTATSGTPGACTCAIPTVVATTSDDGVTGTVTLTITDAQARLRLVEFQTQEGTLPESAWFTDSAAPYSTTVVHPSGGTGRISWRITYMDCAGDDAVDLTGTITFPTTSVGGDIIESGDVVYEDGNPLYE